MNATKLYKLCLFYIDIIKQQINQPLSYFSINLLSLLGGFFIANALATLPGQTGDWAVVVSGILVSIIEIMSKIIYSQYKKDKVKNNIKILIIMNNIKIGVIYGFFVDAFKLGS
uniref:hypothetical protein n=1 Tax=Erythrolobus coxiae TaxID=362235 RepID=UPI001FCE0281|nr:hypothetical protein MW556_pgp150 [Erythrolobus coxiae]UNJ17657.1 hypothetical protein [Erythrolobus coxiae]